MSRELTADADLRFEGFASYPNSAAFEPSSFLEYAKNVRISQGVVTPRKGCRLMVYFGNYNSPDYAVSAMHTSGEDSILVMGGDSLRYYPQTNTANSEPAASFYLRVRGQGYTDALCTQTLDTDYVAGGNITQRLVTAKNDQLRFTLYGGQKVHDTDTLSLIQGTYDPIKAILTDHNSVIAFGSRSIYAVKAGAGYLASQKKPDALHQVQRISSMDGVSGKDACAKMGPTSIFFDVNRRPGFKVLSGEGFSEGSEPMSSAIQDIIDDTDPAHHDKVCIVACAGRFYASMRFKDGRTRVLVMNPSIKGMFESIDEYEFNPNTLLVARYNGIPRVFAVDYTDKLIYMLDEYDKDDRNPHVASGQKPITSEIRTRNYSYRSMSDKKYEAFYVQMDNATGSDVQISAITINPDSEHLIDKFSNATGATIRRGLINKRSMGAKLKVIVTGGSPRILSIGLDATMAGRSLFSIY